MPVSRTHGCYDNRLPGGRRQPTDMSLRGLGVYCSALLLSRKYGMAGAAARSRYGTECGRRENVLLMPQTASSPS